MIKMPYKEAHITPVQLQGWFALRPAELHIFHRMREQRHLKKLVGVEGQTADTHLKGGWF